MPPRRKSNRIDITMSPKTAKHFADLQKSVRRVGHSEPTPRTLVSALIMAETRRGKALEEGLLVPFRNDQADAE
jgi:hypothetical protein